MEKRKEDRIPRRVKVWIELEDRCVQGYSTNISLHGMSLVMTRAFPKNTSLVFKTEVGGKTVAFRGLVRWSNVRQARLSFEPPNGFGIFFIAPPPELKKLIGPVTEMPFACIY